MIDKLVDTGTAEQHDPATSSPPSFAHPGEWIRRYNIRYTLKGVILIILNLVTLTASTLSLNPIRHKTNTLNSPEKIHKKSNNRGHFPAPL
jgi:hypothetical protein